MRHKNARDRTLPGPAKEPKRSPSLAAAKEEGHEREEEGERKRGENGEGKEREGKREKEKERGRGNIKGIRDFVYAK